MRAGAELDGGEIGSDRLEDHYAAPATWSPLNSSSSSRSRGATRWTWRVVTCLIGMILLGCAHRHGIKYPVVDSLAAGILLDSEPSFPVPKGELRPIVDRGIRLTKKAEGFRPHLYEDAARYCTIAYGHLVKKAPCDGSESADFRRGLSEPAGAHLLTNDMTMARQAVTVLVTVSLSDGQYAALCDFVYNVGSSNFSRSTLLKDVNQRQVEDIPIQFKRWTFASGKELPGLKDRRDREVELFFEGELTPKAAPPEGENVSPIDIRKGE